MALETMTFKALAAKLTDLGFSQFRITGQGNGKAGWLFERNNPPNASFYLPDYKEDDEVTLFDLSAVLSTLRSRGLIQETNPLLS